MDETGPLAQYLLMCDLWAEARRAAELAVVEAMRAEDLVRIAEEHMRHVLTGEKP